MFQTTNQQYISHLMPSCVFELYTSIILIRCSSCCLQHALHLPATYLVCSHPIPTQPSGQGYDQQNGRFEHRRRGTLNLSSGVRCWWLGLGHARTPDKGLETRHVFPSPRCSKFVKATSWILQLWGLNNEFHCIFPSSGNPENILSGFSKNTCSMGLRGDWISSGRLSGVQVRHATPYPIPAPLIPTLVLWNSYSLQKNPTVWLIL